MTLVDKECKPCEGGMSPLSRDGVDEYKPKVEGWDIVLDGEEGDRYGANRKLKKEYEFDDFVASINFVKKIAELAEDEGHHPNIHIYYNKVVLELTTHAIGGLSENDFIMAAKINQI